MEEQQESLDHWLMSIDKAQKNKNLPSNIFKGVREFYGHKFKHDAMMIQNTELYNQLKPRL